MRNMQYALDMDAELLYTHARNTQYAICNMHKQGEPEEGRRPSARKPLSNAENRCRHRIYLSPVAAKKAGEERI